MPRIHWARTGAVLSALAMTGCHGPGYSPYNSGGYSSPYGAGSYGGYGQPYMQPYGQPIQTMTPGPSYVPGTTIPPGGYAPAGVQPMLQPSPDGTFRPGASSAPTSGLTPVGEPPGSAPPYNPPADIGGDRSVPLPRDSVNFQPPVQLDPLGSPFRPIAPVSPLAEGNGLQPVSGTAGASPWARETNPAFQPALGDNGEPIKANKPIIPIGEGTAPFAYDAENYRWMRGVVSYEKQDGFWSLVYSDAPDEADELAGCVTIADQALLQGVGDGEIILVTGEFSTTDTDPRGKPIYVVRNVTRHGKAEFASREPR